MGKFEKLVLLTVLFVVMIVLAISLNRGSDPVEASDPLSGARERLDLEGLSASEMPGSELPGSEMPGHGATPAGGVEPEATPADGEAPAMLLNAGLDAPEAGLRPTTPALTLEPRSDPSSRILGDVTGLRPSFLDEYMMYTVVEGDTWSGLAQRFYQDGQYTRNLHIANEDMPELVPGKEILVPVFDFLAETNEPAAQAAPTLAQPTPGTTPTGTTPAKPAEAAPLAKPLSTAKLPEYEVRPGDTLSDISLAVFGTAGRWKEILDANTDKLKKPEGLQVGMKLKIPAGGKLPAAGAAKAKSEKPKTATAQATDKSTSPKKKKVL
jgi:nucleoid-associated protein YgaU